MSYLAYTAESELSTEESKELSIKIGMAVLLGKNIYNITELVKINAFIKNFINLVGQENHSFIDRIRL